MSYTLVRKGLMTEQTPSNLRTASWLSFRVSPAGQPNPRNPEGTGSGDGDHFDLISNALDYITRNYTYVDYLYIEVMPGVYEDPCVAGYIAPNDHGDLTIPSCCRWVDITGIDAAGNIVSGALEATYTIPGMLVGEFNLYLQAMDFHCERISLDGALALSGPLDLSCTPPYAGQAMVYVIGGFVSMYGNINLNLLKSGSGTVLYFQNLSGKAGWPGNPAFITMTIPSEKAGHNPVSFEGCNMDISMWNLTGVNIHAGSAIEAHGGSMVTEPASITGIGGGMTFDGTCGLTRDQHTAIV